MKRLMLATIVLGIFVAPVRAQSPSNCTYLTAFISGDSRTYDPGNQYIASETVTWTVTCKNTSTNTTTYSGTNAVAATGQGGWNNGYPNVFVACNPTFGYAIGNPTTTASNNYLQNVGQDNNFDINSKACYAGAYHINTT